MDSGSLATAAVTRVGELIAGRWRLERLERVDPLAASYTASDGKGGTFTLLLLHEQLATVEAVASSFVAAARASGAIPHPDAVAFIDDGKVSGGAAFVVLGPAQGETLAGLVERRPGRIPPAEALRIVSDVLSVLAAAHAEGVVHGALRPDSVVLDDRGVVLVTGFGLRGAYLAATSHFGAEPPFEVVAFTPPELARNPAARPTGSCDVWCASALLFYLLLGEPVQAGASPEAVRRALAAQPPRLLRSLARDAPRSLDRLLSRGLALSPRERFASARSMRAAVVQAMAAPEVVTLRALRALGAPASMRQEPPPSQRSTPVPGGEGPASAPPSWTRSVPLPPTPPPVGASAGPRAERDHVVVGPGAASVSSSTPVERAATLPAFPSPSAPDSAPQSARDGSLVYFLGRAWVAHALRQSLDVWTDRLVKASAERLRTTGVPATLQVLPWGLRDGDSDAWEADLGVLPVVHRLYSGGARSLVIGGVLTHATAAELITLPWTLDEDRPGGDVRCALWARRWDGVTLGLDQQLFARGNPARLAEERRELIALAQFDTRYQLEDCWQSASPRRAQEAAGAWRAEHQAALAPLYALGLQPGGLQDAFRRRLAAALEAEAGVQPERLEFLAQHAFQVRQTFPPPPPPTRPERHDARVEAIAALSRLVELAGAEAPAATLLEAAHAVVAALGYARELGEATLDVFFGDEVLLVSGQPLRAGRAAHAAADGMAQLLTEHGASRLTLDTRVTVEDVLALHDACTASVRGHAAKGIFGRSLGGITFEAIDGPRGRTPPSEGLGGYAAALVALRSFHQGVRQGAPTELRWLRHIAHHLVDLSSAGGDLGLSVLALAHTHRDDAARALHTALLALAMASQVGAGRDTLARVALAALLEDLGRLPGGEAPRSALPGRMVALCFAAGGDAPELGPTLAAAFGASWLEQGDAVGALGALEPLLTARLVHQAGQVVEAVSAGDRSHTPAEALRLLLQRPGADLECACLLVATLGALPVGTVVELDNGAWAVVASPELHPDRLDRPTVRLVTTDAGRAVERPVRAELQRALASGPQRVARLVPAASTRFNLVQALRP